jgi:type II secretory pathway component PulJ
MLPFFHARQAEARGLQLAQLNADLPTSTERSPRVIIEEPRPPSLAIETEGRGDRHDCRSVTITERKNGVPVIRTEQLCER